MSITEISVKRPTLVVVLFTILSFFGLMGYQNLTYELLPDISTPVITITTIYPGASPEEVENSVTKEIEEAVSALESLDKVRSFSMESVSSVIVEFDYGVDIDQLVQDAQRKVAAIQSELPDDVKAPSVGKFSFNELPIMRIGATSSMDEVAFTNLFENRIKQELADKTHTFYAELYGIDLSPPIEDKDTELALACLLQLNEKKQEFVEACMESYWSNGLSLNNVQSIINILSSLNIKQNIDLSDAAIKALAEHNNNAMADHGFLHSPSYVLDGQVFIGRQHQPLIESMLSTSPD